MILSPDDMADAHVDIVRARCQMISRHPIGTQEREVFNIIRLFDLLTIDRIVEADLLAPASGNTKTQGKRLSGCGPAVTLGPRQLAHSWVEKPSVFGRGL